MPAVRFRSRLKQLALDAFYSFKPNHIPKNLSKSEWLALKELSKNKDIIITLPDKGNGVVVLNRHDYVTKMNSLLLDRSKFKQLQDDPVKLTLK